MNKEYVYLSDKELLVIDENGHATKRNVESDNMHDVLLIENDLEKIDEAITKLKKIIQQSEESELSTKAKIILAIMPFIVGMSAYGIACLISPTSVIPHLITATLGIALGTAAIDLSFIVSTRYYPKYINGIKSELSTAYELRKELEQRLSNSKEKSKDSITQNIIETKKTTPKINDVVILEESTQFCEEATNKLHESYETGYRQKVKRKILKK